MWMELADDEEPWQYYARRRETYLEPSLYVPHTSLAGPDPATCPAAPPSQPPGFPDYMAAMGGNREQPPPTTPMVGNRERPPPPADSLGDVAGICVAAVAGACTRD